MGALLYFDSKGRSVRAALRGRRVRDQPGAYRVAIAMAVAGAHEFFMLARLAFVLPPFGGGVGAR